MIKTGYRCTDKWADGWKDGQAWIHKTSPSRGPKSLPNTDKNTSGGLWVFLLLQLLEKVSFNINMFRSLRVIASNIRVKKKNTELFWKFLKNFNTTRLTNILYELHFSRHQPLSTDYLNRTRCYCYWRDITAALSTVFTPTTM